MKHTYDNWWSDKVGGDLSMERDHDKGWERIISLYDPKDIIGKNILDFGCNRGNFLRKLYDRYPFKSAVGVDLATKAIQAAKENAKDYPVEYVIEKDIRKLDKKFDTAVSTSVLYLIEDLNEHFSQIYDVLENGGVYYATFTDQTKNPSKDYLWSVIFNYGATPMQDHSLTEIVDRLREHSFNVELFREHLSDGCDVTRYDDFYLNVDDYLTAYYNNSFLIKAVKTEE